MSPDELREWACKVTGLADFGADDFGDGLAVLCDSLSAEAGLTPRGEKAARAMLRGALVARLMSQAGFATHPDGPLVRRPVVVTGLPRTGTTFLHRLLVADPGNQGLELWLAEAPQPRPPRSSWASNPMYQQIAAGLARHGGLPGVHEMGPDQVEECWQLLRQCFRSVSFECLTYVPSYSAWLASAGWLGAYLRHRENLRLIGFDDGDRRWVLKNPSHLFALDALMAVYPDACVVVTDRDPCVAIASACSLSAHASAGWSSVFTGPVIGRTQLDLWSRGMSSFVSSRARYPAAQFLDVSYADLVTDPLALVHRVYEHFGLSLSEAAVAAMRPLATASAGSAGSAGEHAYSLADYALTEADVLARFPDPIPAQPTPRPRPPLKGIYDSSMPFASAGMSDPRDTL